MAINLSPKDKYKHYKTRKKATARVRRNLILILIGCGLVVAGLLSFKEYLVLTEDPTVVNLYNLEQGLRLDSRHLLLQGHIALFPEAAYTYDVPDGGSKGPQPNYSVDHIYYPVVSRKHPYVKKITQVARTYGGLRRIPDSARPKLETFAVLVKTDRYQTVGDIPEEAERRKDLQGVVKAYPFVLARADKKMVAEAYPGLDPSSVLVVEPYRFPSQPLTAFGMIGAGGVIMILGMVLFFVRRKKSYDKWDEGMRG